MVQSVAMEHVPVQMDFAMDPEDQQKCATPVQGLCPTGWHIPSHYEWTFLVGNVGTPYPEPNLFPYNVTYYRFFAFILGRRRNEGTNLESITFFGTNSSGFNALPDGYSYGGSFSSASVIGCWWSATESDASDAWYRDLGYYYVNVVYVYTNNKAYGYSIRCVKN